MGKEKTYYEQTIEKLIEEFKYMVDQCLNIVGQTIDEDIKDDKLYNVLKAKRQAAEDAKWAAREIGILQGEIEGESSNKKETKPTNFAERMVN